MWNKNERKGQVGLIKGKIKQAVGRLIRNDDAKTKGRVHQTVGAVDAVVGRTRHKPGHVIMQVGNALKW